MNTLARLICRHIRGKPCSSSQIAVTKDRMRATCRALAMLAGALILAVELAAIVYLAFAL